MNNINQEQFEEIPVKGLQVPNGYIAIPVSAYIDYEMQARALSSIYAAILEECANDADYNYYNPRIDVEKLVNASYGYFEMITQKQAQAMKAESEAEA